MEKRIVFICFTMIVLGTGCFQDSENIGYIFPGLWRLQVIETRDSVTGQWLESGWMKGGIGYLHYGADETMSVHFVPAGFRQANPQDLDHGSLPRKSLEVLASDYWYVGKYRVLSERKEVEHQRVIHSDPNEWGRIVRRSFQFNGDTLILFAPEFGYRLKWIRSEAQVKDIRELVE